MTDDFDQFLIEIKQYDRIRIVRHKVEGRVDPVKVTECGHIRMTPWSKHTITAFSPTTRRILKFENKVGDGFSWRQARDILEQEQYVISEGEFLPED